jgi:hypothetical protein
MPVLSTSITRSIGADSGRRKYSRRFMAFLLDDGPGEIAAPGYM